MKMKYSKYFFRKMIKIVKGFVRKALPFLFIVLIMFLSLISEGYTLEDFGLDGFSLNPNDYCNLTDILLYCMMTQMVMLMLRLQNI